ncbi:pentatricopeptide repeat-containing protein At2g20710, mitochondrial-like [Andrographis paniculata]|uniref:pentatricopeptide repeat-containing protein At2g20710, mitochondrial-like n=1 Tax=Andrographis paniculata TaxID=175694 RepID=UPI0021E89B25|nr:pentatricopeptide repeat-containing protein At2g20710, mitochondrial-like [Andrographis paniculata]
MKIFSISCYLNSKAHSFYRRMHVYQHCLYSTRSSTIRRGTDHLFSRISHLGDPKLSVVPALDRWIAEGKCAYQPEIREIIQDLFRHRRFKQALEVSFWMTNKRSLTLAPFDAATRLKLIHRVFGLDQTEDYFNKIPENLRTYHVYLALLNCYTIEGSVEKAESLMEKARNSGYATKPIWYNLVMDLHWRLGNTAKARDLLKEMAENGIPYDQFTLSVCIKDCAESHDAKGLDKIVAKMDQNPGSIMQWRTRITAAQGYLRAGAKDRALAILEMLEQQALVCKPKRILFAMLFQLYGEAGSKDRLYRVWDLYKKSSKPITKVYIQMMYALRMFGDFEGMKKIYEEWESCGLDYDFRVVNFLIEAYCAQGDMEKAEALFDDGVSKGGDPVVMTWGHLARGYLASNQVDQAIDALKRAILICPPRFKSHKETLISCLDHVENGNGDRIEEVRESLMSLSYVGKIRVDKWLDLIKDKDSPSF